MKKSKKLDLGGPSKGSDHYKHGDIEPIDYIFAQGWGPAFCLGNVVKYATRCMHGDSYAQDLGKAIHYIEMLLERTA